jgi:hypothetical protein
VNVVLEGVVGSRAYGMAGPDSDVDTLGVFLAPTRDLLGLHGIQESVVAHEPDVTHHELGKFCRLLLKGNPTCLELLYLDGYTRRTDEGDWLLSLRHRFLSAPAVRGAYGGFAKSQLQRLRNRADGPADPRYPKLVRHLFRLLLQGTELLETGTLRVRLTEAEVQRLFDMGERDVDDVVRRGSDELAWLDKCPTALPEAPDEGTVDAFLRDVRADELVETCPGCLGLGGDWITTEEGTRDFLSCLRCSGSGRR